MTFAAGLVNKFDCKVLLDIVIRMAYSGVELFDGATQGVARNEIVPTSE